MDLGLAETVALVTGGSAGIGLATARVFLEEGARVAILARGEERLRAAAGSLARDFGEDRVFAAPCDVLESVALDRFARQTAERFGGIDHLIANAGGGRVSTFASTSDEDWRGELDLKFFSVIRPLRAVLPSMRARGGGRVVIVNAILARQPEPHMVATSAARAGVLNLAHSLARELAPDRVLVNTVCLGLIESEQWRRRHQERAPDLTEDAYFRQLADEREIPLRRMGTPREVAGSIAFLCSRFAAYTTGATLDIGGGNTFYV